MRINASDYVRLMVPFLKGLPDAIRSHEEHPELKYYGTGEAGHWSVQCNQQMAGALAVLAEDPDLEKYDPAMSAEELRELALSMFRYSLRTHLTGDLVCTDGKQWGKHWISVLGMERAVPGLNVLEPYFTEDDKARYKAFRIFESDYRLNEYPIRACMDGQKGANVPESNIWNAGFLMRTALDYPELEQAPEYLNKATHMMLNGLSYPPDGEDQTVYNGKTVAEWHVGPNFTENFSLDHHGYMNVGYSYICLSNLALLYFNFKERGQTMPPELLHNVKKLWDVVKNFVFPDGRLLRIGGDSRSRYNYCQCFAISAWIFAAELFRDPDAVRFEKEFLALMEKEQSENADGSFYGTRLSELKDYSYYYYRRLEADPMHALSTGAYWRRKFEIFNEGRETEKQDLCWSDDFHKAVMIRTGNTVRSAVKRAEHSQEILCLPLDRSDMAEWDLNLTGYIGCHFMVEDGDAFIKKSAKQDAFTYVRKTVVSERAPMGEGEEIYQVAERRYACAALPDGKTLLVLERVKMLKETTFTFGFRSLHCCIPNDVYNDKQRVWSTPEAAFTTKNLHGKNELLETGSTVLNCDGAVSFFALGENTASFKIKQSAKQNVFLQCGLWSMYADEVCMDATLDPIRSEPGTILYDTVCAVAADTDSVAPRANSVTENGDVREVTFFAFDGKTYTFKVDFSTCDAQLLCEGETVIC